jgi:hypothetical protein
MARALRPVWPPVLAALALGWAGRAAQERAGQDAGRTGALSALVGTVLTCHGPVIGRPRNRTKQALPTRSAAFPARNKPHSPHAASSIPRTQQQE